MNSDYATIVLDAGARYGLHPTWKPFTGEMNYYLFEADTYEAERLKVKYENRRNEIVVVGKAVAEKNGKLTLNLFHNRAMATTVERNPVSSLFQDERLQEVEVNEQIEIDAVSFDYFCKEKGIRADFLKLDTEGTEFGIMKGAVGQIENNILGLRSEVAFDYIFKGMPLFGDLNQFMLERGFFLLNIDYDGRGDYQNESVKVDGRYGILTSSDAVWLRRMDTIFDKLYGNSNTIEEQIFKYAAFCFNNHASDVAIKVMLIGREKYGLDYRGLKGTRLYAFMDKETHRLFYSLKWQPGQSLVKNQEAYFAIFDKKMKVMNEYMESLELNPD
jgi:FkbM family methyltransferase